MCIPTMYAYTSIYLCACMCIHIVHEHTHVHAYALHAGELPCWCLYTQNLKPINAERGLHAVFDGPVCVRACMCACVGVRH